MAGGELAQFFARTAALEAASVIAFRVLAAELRIHRADAVLIRSAEASAFDEEYHAELMNALALRYNAPPSTEIHIPAMRPRPLVELAIENAIEGCVYETYAAAIAQWQSAAAGDREVRRAMAIIAVDESRHAALAWAVDAWASSCLTASERRLVAAAQLAASLALEERSRLPVAPILTAVAGLPTAAQSASIVTDARELLWTRAA